MDGTWKFSAEFVRYYSSFTIAKNFCLKDENCFGVTIATSGSGDVYSIQYPVLLRMEGDWYMYRKENDLGISR